MFSSARPEPSRPRAPLPPPRDPSTRGKRLFLTVLALLGLVSLLSPARLDHLPAACPWRVLTGAPCPFCGLTHSLAALSHGDFRQAFAFHPFGPALYLLGLTALALAARSWRTGRPLLLSGRPRLVLRALLIACAAAWALWWGWGLLR